MRYREYNKYSVHIKPVCETTFSDDSYYYAILISYDNIPEILLHITSRNKLSEAAVVINNIIEKDMDDKLTLPKLSQLNPFLADWIRECWASDSGMWFVDPDDSDLAKMTENDWNEIYDQIGAYFDGSIEIEDPYGPHDDYVVCCYGSCIEYVNWLENENTI